MKPVASPGPMRLRVVASTLLKPLRRLRKKHLSTFHNPALTWIASHAARLRRLTLRRTTVIGITGSCGKTTTTILTGMILSAKGACHVKASGNTHYAAMRSMLSVRRSTRFCVHEVAAYVPGSIARAVKILRPQIGIVTNIGTDHYRQFRSLEATAREKAALVTALPLFGTAILNADDPHVREMTSCTRARVVTYGLSSDADIKATEVSSRWPERLALTVKYGDQRVRIQTQLVGEHWANSVLAAIACGIVCGVGLDDCAEAVKNFEPVFGRYSVHSKPGMPAYVLDTRKAPAWTLPHSLAFVGHAQAPRKTIVFGTLSDAPGGWTSARYRRLARQALEVADRVVFVGPQAGHVDKMREGAIKHRLFSFLTAYQASLFLAGDTHEDELILIKASITDHLERIMLHKLDYVACWRQRCGRHMDCPECSLFRTPQPPPFAIAHDDTQAGLPKVAQPTSLMGSEPC